MKTLQNNFTTPEQSKRLLKLGMPAESADMHYHQECVRMEYGKEEFEYFIRYGRPDTNKYSTDIPCWSVGRLMEIYDICTSEYKNGISIPRNHIVLDRVLIEFFGALQHGDMDFSKLEE